MILIALTPSGCRSHQAAGGPLTGLAAALRPGDSDGGCHFRTITRAFARRESGLKNRGLADDLAGS
jgi:hypothetical protein